MQQAVNLVLEMKGLVSFKNIELLDKLQTEACVNYSKINYLDADKITILMQLAGNQQGIEEESQLILNHLKQMNLKAIKIFPDEKSAEEIWMMRKNACPAAISFIDKSKKAMATDVSVPLSTFSDCIEACYAHMKELGIRAPLVAHVGDGNFHFTIILNPDDPFELFVAKLFNQRVVEEGIKSGGTCTGEHGIGLGKMEHLKAEHGDSLFLMEQLKKSIDPIGIFNPGKIITLGKEFKHCQELSFHTIEPLMIGI